MPATAMAATVAPLESFHRFHGYCARFPSDLVDEVLRTFTKPGDSIHDPFCGSGTTLVTGLVRGRGVIGSDIDPIAGLLSSVKCHAKPSVDYEAWLRRFAPRVTRAIAEVGRRWSQVRRRGPSTLGETLRFGSVRAEIPEFRRLNYWFPPQVMVALAAISTMARACRDAHFREVALVSLSACVIAKWPHTLSYAMDVDHTRPHRRIQRITLERVAETYLMRLGRTTQCLGNLWEAYRAAGFGDRARRPATVMFPHDAREPLDFVAEESQASVITSPPYFDAVDYPRSHRLSVCWMNGYAPADLGSRRRYIGLRHAGPFDAARWLAERPAVRRLIPPGLRDAAPGQSASRLTAFFSDLDDVLGQAWRTLRPGGWAVLVIADNTVQGSVVPSHAIVGELGRAMGFRDISSRQRHIDRLRRRYPVGPFGFNGPMTREYVVAMQKPKPSRRVGNRKS